jgi:hypothetical protein
MTERTYHQSLTELATLRDDVNHRTWPVGREDSWTPEKRRDLSISNALDGMLWAYSSMRLSFAAEEIIRNADDLTVLAGAIADRIDAEPGYVHAIGFVATVLNTMGREAYARTAGVAS